MIKFSGSNRESGLPVLGIGLSRENCDRLLQGQPILFTTEGMGIPEMEVSIIAGETEVSITHALLEMGALTPDQIQEDRSLADPHVHAPKGEAN